MDAYWHDVCETVWQDTDNLWWDSFATDFFEDDATLTLTFGLEDGVKRYSMYIVQSFCACKMNQVYKLNVNKLLLNIKENCQGISQCLESGHYGCKFSRNLIFLQIFRNISKSLEVIVSVTFHSKSLIVLEAVLKTSYFSERNA